MENHQRFHRHRRRFDPSFGWGELRKSQCNSCTFAECILLMPQLLLSKVERILERLTAVNPIHANAPFKMNHFVCGPTSVSMREPVVTSSHVAEEFPAKTPKQGCDPLSAIDLRTPANSSDESQALDLVIDSTAPCQRFGLRKSERLLAKAKLGRDSSRANVPDRVSTIHPDASASRLHYRGEGSLSESARFGPKWNRTLDITVPCEAPQFSKNGVPVAPGFPDAERERPLGDPHTSITIMPAYASNFTAISRAHPDAAYPTSTGVYPTHTYYHYIQHPNPPPYGFVTSATGILQYAPYHDPPPRDGHLQVPNIAKTKATTTSRDDGAEPSALH